MLLKQIILTKSIPFEVTIPKAYTNEEKLIEMQATMSMEDMQLLRTYQLSEDKDIIRKQLLAELKEV